MASVAKISDAASLAMHAMAYLAGEPHRFIPVNEMAENLKVSLPHLAKVFQRLAKAGLVHSVRGPKGGFQPSRDPKKISLLDVYEAIEGEIERERCVLGLGLCSRERCIFGGMLESVNEQFRSQLASTDLTQLTWLKEETSCTGK